MITTRTDPSLLSDEKLQHLFEKHWVCLENALPEEHLEILRRACLEGWRKDLFQPAKIGRSSQQQLKARIRSDSIAWIPWESPDFALLAQVIRDLKQQLNRSLFLGIQDFECHFARYSEGQFYEAHIDQPKLKSSLHGERVISLVLYLNPHWQTSHGGELVFHLPTGDLRIEPKWGRLMLFRSGTILHSVLPSQAERWSLTGWFRKI